jgi:hypothetical protein
LLQKFGTKLTRSNSKWKRLINSDFSGRINLMQKHNSKNDVVWSKNKTGEKKLFKMSTYVSPLFVGI